MCNLELRNPILWHCYVVTGNGIRQNGSLLLNKYILSGNYIFQAQWGVQSKFSGQTRCN